MIPKHFIALCAVLLLIAFCWYFSIKDNSWRSNDSTSNEEPNIYGQSLTTKKTRRAYRQNNAIKKTSSATGNNKLLNRVSSLRHELTKSNDPSQLLSSILSDIENETDYTRKQFLITQLKNELSYINEDSENKLEWFAQVYQSVKEPLDGFTVYPRTLRQEVFALIYSKCHSRHIDAYEEISKFKDPQLKVALLEGILPYMITNNLYEYPDIMQKLPIAGIKRVQQEVISEAAANRVYRAQALDMYLKDGGLTGIHQKTVAGLFNDSGWFWNNSEQVAKLVSNSNRGNRRDEAIANMIKLINRKDPDAAEKWLSEISDPTKRLELKSKYFNP